MAEKMAEMQRRVEEMESEVKQFRQAGIEMKRNIKKKGD